MINGILACLFGTQCLSGLDRGCGYVCIVSCHAPVFITSYVIWGVACAVIVIGAEYGGLQAGVVHSFIVCQAAHLTVGVV